MKSSWNRVWSSAQGPVNELAPHTRILCGACVFAACLITPVATWPGVGAVAALVGLWLAVVRPPVALARSTAIFGLVLFLPYFLLAPLIRAESASGDWSHAFAVPWKVFFRGMTAMQVSVSTASALSQSELRQGLARLPFPRVVSAVLIQIVHQTSALVDETRRVAGAIAVRGGTSGYRTMVRVLTSFPRVWLPRVIDRAERVGAVMDLRGYGERQATAMGSRSASWGDALAVGTALATLTGVVALRFWGAF